MQIDKKNYMNYNQINTLNKNYHRNEIYQNGASKNIDEYNVDSNCTYQLTMGYFILKKENDILLDEIKKLKKSINERNYVINEMINEKKEQDIIKDRKIQKLNFKNEKLQFELRIVQKRLEEYENDDDSDSDSD